MKVRLIDVLLSIDPLLRKSDRARPAIRKKRLEQEAARRDNLTRPS